MAQDQKQPPFSLRKSFRYMGMVYSSPKSLVGRFREELSLLYGFVPRAIFVEIYEILYYLDIVFQSSPGIPVLRILPIPDSEYQMAKLFFAPFFNLADYLVFAGVINLFLRSLRITKIKTREMIIFFMLIWNTVGLMAALGDLFNFFWPLWIFTVTR